MPRSLRPAAIAMLAAALAAQQPDVAVEQEPSAPAPASRPGFVQLRYPRDREYTVATVDGRAVWLEELIQHIDERHNPGFRQLMLGPEDQGTSGKGTAYGKRILESDLIAAWVRYFADIKALETEAKGRDDFDAARVEACLSAALKAGFEEHLKGYVADLQAHSLPTELSQKRIDSLLNEFQLRFGLACELQGWLDYLMPAREWSSDQLNAFFQAHPRYFGGGVKIAHILIQNRDASTGILLEEAGRKRAAARLAEVQAQLRPDGSNFADLARRFSDDTRTGRDGGVLDNVERFDQRLPAALCRTAWDLQDGETSDVIETQYGWHLVHRIEHVQRMFMLFSEATTPMVRDLLQRKLQEDMLFEIRAAHAIELKL